MKYVCFMAVLDAIDWDIHESNPASCRARIVPIAPRVLLADDQEEILLTIAALLEEEFGQVPPVMEMVTFIRQSKRGINATHHFHDSGNQVVVFRPPLKLEESFVPVA